MGIYGKFYGWFCPFLILGTETEHFAMSALNFGISLKFPLFNDSPLKLIKKCFLFYLKSYFCSQYI